MAWEILVLGFVFLRFIGYDGGPERFTVWHVCEALIIDCVS